MNINGDLTKEIEGIIDLLKSLDPNSDGYKVLMNNIQELMEQEIGRFILTHN